MTYVQMTFDDLEETRQKEEKGKEVISQQKPIETRYRRNDPSTSVAAAKSIRRDIGKDGLTALQKRVLCILKECSPEGVTLDRLITLCREPGEYLSDSTIRTRCSELVQLGFAENATKDWPLEKKPKTASGRHCDRFRAKE